MQTQDKWFSPHLVFGQGLTFAFLILDTTRDPKGSDVGLDTAKIGRCGTGGVGHCAVKAVGAGKADIRESLRMKFESEKHAFELPRNLNLEKNWSCLKGEKCSLWPE